MSIESPVRIPASDFSLLIQLLNKSKADDIMEDIHRRIPWAHAVWLQCRNDGWVAFVRADMGGYSTEPCKTAIEAVTELWMHYSERGWKQEKEKNR